MYRDTAGTFYPVRTMSSAGTSWLKTARQAARPPRRDPRAFRGDVQQRHTGLGTACSALCGTGFYCSSSGAAAVNGSGACDPGYYCEAGSKTAQGDTGGGATLCPAGKFGAGGSNSSACNGPCAPCRCGGVGETTAQCNAACPGGNGAHACQRARPGAFVVTLLCLGKRCVL